MQGYIDELTLSTGVMSPCEILEKATLAAWFSFDASPPLLDLGPNSVSSNGSNYNFVTGQSLQAISFTGSTSSYFQASGLLALGAANQPFSFSFWVQPQSLIGTLVQLSTNASGTGMCASLLGFASNGSLIAQVRTNTSYVATSYTNLTLTDFSHVVETWSSTNGLRLYVNGYLVSSVPATSYLGTSVWTNYVTVGGCLNGCASCSAVSGNQISSGPFTGAVDDFRIYTRELTAADVCTLYAYG